MLRSACLGFGRGRLHATRTFRRFWATAAAQRLPRWEAALAGGWRGTDLPSISTTWASANYALGDKLMRGRAGRSLSGIGRSAVQPGQLDAP